MRDTLDKLIRTALAPSFRHIDERLDRFQAEFHQRLDRLQQRLEPDMRAGGTQTSYLEFWQTQTASMHAAMTAVGGRPFGLEPTEALFDLHGEIDAEMIARGLEIEPGHDVLEYGAGIGRLAGHLSARCRYYRAAELAPGMIDWGRRRIADRPNLEWLDLSAQGPAGIPERCADRLLAQVVLVHLDDPEIVDLLRHLPRVLRPGGRAWLQFYHPDHEAAFARLREQILPPDQPRSRGFIHFRHPEQIRVWLRHAAPELQVMAERSRLAPGEPWPFGLDDTFWRDIDQRLLDAVADHPGLAQSPQAWLEAQRRTRPPGLPDAEWEYSSIWIVQLP